MYFAPARWSSDRTMRAARISGVRSPVEMAQMSVPEIDDDDALVRIVASGVCRSDWHIWNGDWVWNGVAIPEWGVLGHEIGGVVEAVGRNVTRVKPGQRVTVPFHLSCGHCHYCTHGEQNRCEDGASSNGFAGSGGWAEYMRVPNANLNCVVLPDEVDELTAAALGCRYMTAWRAVRQQGAIRGGETAAVIGCGGVGLAAVEIAVCLGGEVIAVDVDDSKLALAKEIGARATINAKDMSAQAVGEAVRELTNGGRGADMAVDALGLQQTVNSGLFSLKKGGRLAQVGLTSQEDKGFVNIPLDVMVMKELQIIASQGNPHWAYADLLALVAKGRLKPQRLVTREIKLSEIGEVLHDMDTFKTTGYVIVTDLAR